MNYYKILWTYNILLRQMSKAGRAAALVTSQKPSLKYGNAPKKG